MAESLKPSKSTEVKFKELLVTLNHRMKTSQTKPKKKASWLKNFWQRLFVKKGLKNEKQ